MYKINLTKNHTQPTQQNHFPNLQHIYNQKLNSLSNKLESCARIIKYGGKKKAVPYFSSNRQRLVQTFKNVKTQTQQSYSYRKISHATSNSKPLVKYTPNHARNILPIIFKPMKLNNIKQNDKKGMKRCKTIEHSYIGNYDGLQESDNPQINRIRRHHYKYLISLHD